jgi:ABC-2 type transport system permease protein
LKRDQSKNGRFEGRFAELLKVEGKLALREPTGIGMGIGAPLLFLIVFGVIGLLSPGNVANSGFTVLDLYVPTIMVITFIFLGIASMPVNLVKYREMGWLRRISTTPVPPSRILGAQLAINLLLALASILIVILGSQLIFGAPLRVSIPYFVLSIVLSVAMIFALGLVVAAVVPSQTIASILSGFLTFLMLFLSGLWIQPALVGGPLATIIYYSPAGASVQAVLYSVFNTPPPLTTLGTMTAYTALFAFVAIRYFRWE